MKAEIAEQWATALESGEFKQTKGCLFDGTGYCCLGVLCKLAGKEFKKIEDADEDDISRFGIETDQYKTFGRPYQHFEQSVLPDEVVEWAGLRTVEGSYRINDLEEEIWDDLTQENDQNGKNFKEIAEIIRKNVNSL